MKCKISCSFGEIIDKISILKIKLSKATDKIVLGNIKLELETITNEIPLSKTEDQLFNEIFKVNKTLWDLEDSIREKSKAKCFDNEYIELAENIHIKNDERYQIKRKINEKYNSELKEEKIYNNINKNTISNIDYQNLESGKLHYVNGNFHLSFKILNELCQKFNNYDNIDNFYIELIFSFSNVNKIFNNTNIYENKLDYIMNNLDSLNINEKLKEYCKKQYIYYCLEKKDYKLGYNYINMLNDITGPNVNFKNMSFFEKNDKDKTLLIYDGGGIGDKFMFCRFISKLCIEYNKNKIIFFVNDNLCWIFENVFNFENLQILPYSKNYLLNNNFNYHCSLIYLIKCFNITYNNLHYDEFIFKNINSKINTNNKNIIENIKKTDKKTYILNWKGNKINPHEKSNRGMDLKYALPLFKLNNINWLIITKDLNDEEKKLLNDNNIKYIGNKLDNTNNCFEDSIEVIKHVSGVISTDTSLVHLSANLNIKTFVLLTTGAEWRWTKDEKTNWYPNSILIRQKEHGKWDYVIEELIKKLNYV